jgi:hypothetical protein
MARGRTWTAAALALLCVPLAGCLDYREQLLLRESGAGLLKIDFVVDLGLMTEIAKAFGDQPDPAAQQGPTKDEILQGLKGDGLKVEELDVKHQGEKSKVHLVLRFRSLKDLSQIEGFGDDRKVEFFDNGDGKVRMVYSFDTRDVIPLEELGEEPAPGQKVDPIEKKIFEITNKAREELSFRGKVALPGPILKSNGKRDPRDPKVSVWWIDREHSAEKHKTLGRGKIVMMLLVERSSVPWVKELAPLPVKGADGSLKEPERPKGPRGAPGGAPRRPLGD